MKFLIACLGNIGAEYEDTRHNIGFWVADRLADQHKVSFTTGRLAQSTLIKHRGRSLVVNQTNYLYEPEWQSHSVLDAA